MRKSQQFHVKALAFSIAAILAAPPALAEIQDKDALAAQGGTTEPAEDDAAQERSGSDRGTTGSRQAESEAKPLEQVVVTGTKASNRTVLESSVAVTVVDREGLDRKAPRSTAAALEMIPGFFVEASGGEVSNNFSVRGLAGGGQTFVQLQEDGLPVFYTNALADTILKQEIGIDRLEAVRGGTSGILTVNGAGATVNFLTRKPTDQFESSLRITGSDFDTKRIDFWSGGPMGNDWYFSTGGFFRNSDSVRDIGFTSDRGGIVRGSLTKQFEDGHVSFNVKVVDEHNTFLLPIPLTDPGNPRSIPGLSASSGTMIGLDNAVQTVLTSPATGRSTQVNDLTDGVDTDSTSIGYDFEKELFDGVVLRSKGRYTDFENRFNAVFNFDNATLVPARVRLDPTRFSDIQTLLNRFGPQGAVSVGLRPVSTGELITGDALDSLNGNGLTADSITVKNLRFVEEFVNDISLNWETDRNSLSVGVLFFDTRVEDGNIGASTFISEVATNPRRLDIVALDAQDAVVGSLTDNGLLNFGTWGEGNAVSLSESYSFYFNDEFQATDRLRLDAGVRVENFEITRKEGISAGGPLFLPEAFDANGEDRDNVIANNAIGQFGGGFFTGDFRSITGDFTEVAWSGGGSFLVNDNLAVYGRFSKGFQGNAQNPVTDINFGEFGVRYQARGLSASLTGFRTQFKDFRFSRQPAGAIDQIEFDGDIKVLGVEFDLLWKPVSFFQFQALGVIQNTELDIKDDQGTGFATEFDGNQPERTPETNVRGTASFFLPNGWGEIYVSGSYIGKRFSDLANSLELPSYGTVDAGVSLWLTDNLTLSVNGTNLNDSIGLTEGNPRSGFQENPGVSDFFFARPILGRSFVASLTYDF